MAKLAPADVLRTRDRVNRDLGLTGREPPAELVEKMAAHPTLLQRPLGVSRKRAVLARPVERLLELVQQERDDQ